MSISTLNTQLRDRYDILIVGGGIYGATAAYEAGRRGLSALLLERNDYGSATSSSSMKILHGGLRYLQQFDFKRVIKSHRELRRFLRIAPHVVTPLHCELDLSGRGALFRLKFRAGLLLYGAMTRLPDAGAADCPRLPFGRYPCWHEALVDDTERLLLEFLHTAVDLGGGKTAVRNYLTIESYIRENGLVVGARIPGHGEIGVGAVLECTGVQRPNQPAGLAMNLVFDRLPLSAGGRAVGMTHPTDGRAVFVTPWRDRSIVGTFERDYPFDPTEPLRIEQEWIEEFLAWLAPAHPDLGNLSAEKIRFVHAGLLPRDTHASKELSRDARILRTDDGRLQILGVKYTTSRADASRAVELAAARLGRGGAGDENLPRLIDRRESLSAFVGADPSRPAPLLAGRSELSRGEVLFALENEQARSLSDVLLRRTATASSGYPGDELVEATASLLAERQGWSDERLQEELRAFRADVHFPNHRAR